LLADLITVMLCLGLILTSVDPFYESLFFSGVISYLMIFLLMLIRDLDNPFGYYEVGSSADVTLQPLDDTVGRLAVLAGGVAAPTPAAAVPVAVPASPQQATAPAASPPPASVPCPEPKSKKSKGKAKSK
jgi:hypothetical protein